MCLYTVEIVMKEKGTKENERERDRWTDRQTEKLELTCMRFRYWQIGDTLCRTHEQVDRMQCAFDKVLLCLVHLYESAGSPGQCVGRHQYQAIEVHSMDTLDGRHHAVHPCVGLFISAVGFLLCHHYHTLLTQHCHREHSNPIDLTREKNII